MSTLHSRIRNLKSSVEQKNTASRLGLRVKRARLQPHDKHLPLSDEELAKLLGGNTVAPGVIIVETNFSMKHFHGKIQLQSAHRSTMESVFGAHGKSASDFLFLDTETTGLAGGSGTVVFLLGLAQFVNDEFVVRQLFLRNFSAEKAFLNIASESVKDEQIIVSYNGKSFDVPLLCTRFALHRELSPLQRLAHYDLLHATRRAFSSTWLDCRLQTAEHRLLEFFREQDISGARIPQVWFDFVRTGQNQELPAILMHNCWDLVSLAALTPVLSAVYASNDVSNENVNPLAMARFHRKHGRQSQAMQILQNTQDVLNDVGLMELTHLFKKQKRWGDAVSIWQSLGLKGNRSALEQLAKYFEHIEKNYDRALEVTQTLVQLCSANEAHLHRRQRLLNKLQSKIIVNEG